MAKIEPSKFRAQISDERGGLRIVIPPTRKWYPILLLSIFIAAWVYGLISIVRQGHNKGGGLPLPYAVLAMNVGVGLVTYALFWQVLGREVIIVNGQWLKTRREIGRWGRTHEYMLAQIRDLRAAQGNEQPSFASGMSGGTSIALDYGAKTYRFGRDIDEAEAKEIVKTIKNRFKIQDTHS